MKLGICCDGLEEAFERAILERAKPNEPFVFMEIGTAYCETFLSVCRILEERKALWRAIAIDPWDKAMDAFLSKIQSEFPIEKALMFCVTREVAFATERKRIGNRLDFVFIDGCHSKKCVMGDFQAVEPLVVPRGIVVFHDIEDVPGEIQMHCNAERGVREGLEELGLWNQTRPGWKRLPDWQCDKTKNAFSCAVFEKV